jgi:hypothetical protein
MNLEFHQSITNPQNQNLKLFLKLIIPNSESSLKIILPLNLSYYGNVILFITSNFSFLKLN